ncbi:uncharacterized protein BJ171DRAFT_517468 [Polychytrium aggregatum]|uniref:uncharacterized protein n=1 Tax=Polychytrium aggregatum TaxID=110093 RepID=UPI0022FED9D5|nr:uncharacterized protein BJ171DRAFT_517468 [Polychytrium aggregatum]KAI9199685.1 hypothetical protein BJ171DRAFT_517468 [Polychytrium aggregatum]
MHPKLGSPVDTAASKSFWLPAASGSLPRLPSTTNHKPTLSKRRSLDGHPAKRRSWIGFLIPRLPKTKTLSRSSRLSLIIPKSDQLAPTSPIASPVGSPVGSPTSVSTATISSITSASTSTISPTASLPSSMSRPSSTLPSATTCIPDTPAPPVLSDRPVSAQTQGSAASIQRAEPTVEFKSSRPKISYRHPQELLDLIGQPKSTRRHNQVLVSRDSCGSCSSCSACSSNSATLCSSPPYGHPEESARDIIDMYARIDPQADGEVEPTSALESAGSAGSAGQGLPSGSGPVLPLRTIHASSSLRSLKTFQPKPLALAFEDAREQPSISYFPGHHAKASSVDFRRSYTQAPVAQPPRAQSALDLYESLDTEPQTPTPSTPTASPALEPKLPNALSQLFRYPSAIQFKACNWRRRASSLFRDVDSEPQSPVTLRSPSAQSDSTLCNSLQPQPSAPSPVLPPSFPDAPEGMRISSTIECMPNGVWRITQYDHVLKSNAVFYYQAA